MRGEQKADVEEGLSQPFVLYVTGASGALLIRATDKLRQR